MMDDKHKKMRKAALEALMARMHNHDTKKISADEDMSNSDEGFHDDLAHPVEIENGQPQGADMQMAQADMAHPSDTEAGNAIQRMLNEQGAQPAMQGRESTPPDQMQPNTPAAKAMGNAGALQDPSIGLPEGGRPPLPVPGQEDNLRDRLKQKNRQAYIDEIMRQR